MAGDDVLAELGLDSDLSDDSGTSDSLDVEALLPASGPTSPENKTSTGVPTFAEEPKGQTAAAPAAVAPDLALLESSDAASSSLDGESNLDVEALLETSSPELRAAEQRLEEDAPIAVGERRSSSSSALEEHQSVPMAPRGSGLLFEQDSASAREAALPVASAHREIHIAEVETQPALHSAMPVEKGSAVVGEATAPTPSAEPVRAASDGSSARGSVAQEVHRLEQVIRSRSTSPAQMVVHQPRLPSVQTQACTPDASPTRRSQGRTPDASPTRRAQVKVAEEPLQLQPEVLKEELAAREDREVSQLSPDSAQERLKRVEKANQEAEDLLQEQLSVEISCEVARNLGSLKAQPKIFLAQVAELRLRCNLHKAACERHAELLANAQAAASSPVSPAKPTDVEDLEDRLSKAQRCPEALQQLASDLRTRCLEKEAILRVKLEHDARQLRSQIFASIAARAKAEARLAQDSRLTMMVTIMKMNEGKSREQKPLGVSKDTQTSQERAPHPYPKLRPRAKVRESRPEMRRCSGEVSGVTLDFRTPEEAKLEEQEAQRVERFFDVDHLPEDDYLREWSCKEQALTGILEKLMRSRTVQDALSPAFARSEMSQGHFIPGASAAEGENNEDALEFSYVVPPSEVPRLNSLELDLASEGYRPWNARLILAHSSGSLALVTTTFQHVPPAKGRGELWTCTALRAELIATQGGAVASDPICELQGPLPHGVRYMRL
ncbi:unnamed protein product [Symbiodinium sp. CCMP2456]|nr:unnamed protein product [Symbiodinium sp. CCMP2456]